MTWPCMLALSMGVLVFVAGCVVAAQRLVRMNEPLRCRRCGYALPPGGNGGWCVTCRDALELEDVPTPRQGRRRT